MKRPWQIWLTFALCVLLAVVATGELSRRMIVSNREAIEQRNLADLHQRAQSAIARMEAKVTDIIAKENARPSTDYVAFSPVKGLDPSPVGELNPSEWVQSPLLIGTPLYAKVFFQFDSQEQLTSPQSPRGTFHELALKLGYLEGRFTLVAQTLDWIEKVTSYSELLEGVRLASEASLLTDTTAGSVAATVIKPFWIHEELFLVRQDNSGVMQGIMLDWTWLSSQLSASVADLLPEVQLEPLNVIHPEAEHRLAALPIAIKPGTPKEVSPEEMMPMRVALGVAWLLLLLAATAIGALLQGVLTLSERRAAFVSAVTHELRTPLTTFRLYTEMLLDNMVPDEAARLRYLRTLQAEADRLKHLIENVLAYARIERGRLSDRIRSLTIKQLLEVATQRLAQRAEQGGMTLINEIDHHNDPIEVLADPSAVEQILFNLVDNACKYAVHGQQRLLHLEAGLRHDFLALRVRDHGGGIGPSDQRKLFQPFRKSAKDAAGSAPGVGLGLALCRRLARQMGGDLRYEGNEQGAISR